MTLECKHVHLVERVSPWFNDAKIVKPLEAAVSEEQECPLASADDGPLRGRDFAPTKVQEIAKKRSLFSH
jgi:hypothetical protein